MLTLTSKGLYCAAGDFFIDPKGAVETAVITHAHSDHARRGSRRYITVSSGLGLLKARLGTKISARGVKFGEFFHLGPVKVSLHPAGHILGSAQVRLEYGGEVWVVSGDYKRENDPTCEPFESVTCDVFVTEATFGTPSFVWNRGTAPEAEMAAWWASNAQKGKNSVLLAYSLGKTQRLLGALKPFAKKPIYCHPSSRELNRCYAEQGIELAPHVCLSDLPAGRVLHGDLIIAPPGFVDSPAAAVLGQNYEAAFVSGWMSSGRSEPGFVMSDHADWPGLIQTIRESNARCVYVQHRGQGALVRHLRSLGLRAFPEAALTYRPSDQLSFA